MSQIKLLPSGKTIQMERGITLRDALVREGVEFACGGKGCCKGCRVKVVEGAWSPNEAERKVLAQGAIEEGWRLACQGEVRGPVTLEIAQWEMPVLSDSSGFHFTPGHGLGIAVDVGTTTIAVQLLDLATAEVLAVATALNAQSVHGSDVMTRLEYALNGGAETLTRKIRRQIGDLTDEVLESVPRKGRKLTRVLLAGNTAMHHLFSGLPVETLAREPFQPASAEGQNFVSDELGWSRCGAAVTFLPCLAGFVGSDILAGILATGMHRSNAPVALLDLGTNGEIVVANGGRILCASTAAGPAFEGARISMGMRAATGAISHVEWRGDRLECRVIHAASPRGLCGSGLVDAIAAGLDRNIIDCSGRFGERMQAWPLAGRVSIYQRDVRELQLAKAAITSGLLLLCRELGLEIDDLAKVYLAGAFGNYVSRRSAQRIGLLPVESDRIIPVGNSALLGTKMALFAGQEDAVREVVDRSEHFALNEHPQFQDVFLEQLAFPAQSEGSRECGCGALESAGCH